MLLCLLACQGDLPAVEGPPEPEAPAPDRDADGAPATEDCDDRDASVHPGAEELCDGVDQDCDAEVDEGLITDGAGCREPQAPTPSEVVDVVHLTVRTAEGTYAGTDDPVELCLADEWCWSVDVLDWNDRESGEIDVFVVEGVAMPRAAVERFEIRTSDGANRWEPEAFELSLDDERVYTRSNLDIYIGTDADGELASFSEPLGLSEESAWDSVLTHGPMLGAPAAGEANIWLRTDASRRVVLRVAQTEGALAEAAPVHTLWTHAADDFTAVMHAEGLEAGRTYAYDLEVDGARFGPWRFTTPPPEGEAGRVKIAFGSCSYYDEQPVFGVVLAEAPDLFLFLGDNHYANSGVLGALRQAYRHELELPLRASALRSSWILATWDDHDFVGNNTDGADPGKENALRAFQEYWANRSYGLDATPGVFSSARYGNLEFFLIDDRYWRGLEDSITGAAQEAWLLESVAASTATFKIVASGSQFTLHGSDDSWATFPEAQGRVVDALSAVPGVVLLSGDIHRSEFRVVPAAGYALPELTSSPMSTGNSTCSSDADLLECFDDGDFVIVAESDSTLADPLLTARILDSAGVERAVWEIPLSSLQP